MNHPPTLFPHYSNNSLTSVVSSLTTPPAGRLSQHRPDTPSSLHSYPSGAQNEEWRMRMSVPTGGITALHELLSNTVPCKISLPFKLLPDSPSILERIATVRACTDVELTPPGQSTPSSASVFAQGLALFDFSHIRRLSLPGEILSVPRIQQSLARLPSLQELRLDLTEALQLPINAAGRDDFPALTVLEIVGPLSQVPAVLTGCSRPSASHLHHIFLRSHSLSHVKEFPQTLNSILESCPDLQELEVDIEGMNHDEDARWMDLAILTQFNLRKFVMKHPHPLPLTDGLVDMILTSWPRVRHISLNPHPLSFPARPLLPTWKSLRTFEKKGQELVHFGIFLDLGSHIGPCVFERLRPS